MPRSCWRSTHWWVGSVFVAGCSLSSLDELQVGSSGNSSSNGGATSSQRATQSTTQTSQSSPSGQSTEVASAVDSSSSSSTGGQVSLYREAVLADNPLQYLRFGESSGPNAFDEVTNQPAALYQGNVEHTALSAIASDSVPNQSLSLHEGRVLFLDNAIFDFPGSSPFSIEFWFAADPVATISGYPRILSNENPSPMRAGWDITVSPPPIRLLFERWDLSGGHGVTVPAPFDSAFHQLVTTFDGTFLRLYLDGVLMHSATSMESLPALDHEVILKGTQLNLTVDELAIYSEALSAQRVAIHYLAATTPR